MNRFIILITNIRRFLIFKISRYRRDYRHIFKYILGKLMNSIRLLTNRNIAKQIMKEVVKIYFGQFKIQAKFLIN